MYLNHFEKYNNSTNENVCIICCFSKVGPSVVYRMCSVSIVLQFTYFQNGEDILELDSLRSRSIIKI